MTTVAVNKTSIACDLQFTYRGSTKFKGGSKVLHLKSPRAMELFNQKEVFIGFSGSADTWGNVVAWLCTGEGKRPKCKDMEFLMLTPEKTIYHGTNMSNWLEIPEDHFAIGSGMQLAIAAMSAGKTPLEACKIASKHDPNTGMGFKNYKFK